MDVKEIEAAGWASALPAFECLLRPSGADAPAKAVADGTAEALDKPRQAMPRFGELGDALVDLVFGGYHDWYQYEDAWVLHNLAQVLDDEGAQQTGLLAHLGRICGAAATDAADSVCTDFLTYAEWCVQVWRTEAQQAASEPQDGQLESAQENTASWNYSRTPGTFYYRYRDGKYLYNDAADAPAEDWKELPYWDDLAEAAAGAPGSDLSAVEGWGNEWNGWYAIPTTDPARFGTHVYGQGKSGPWMTRDQAVAAHQTAPAAAAATSSAADRQNAALDAARRLDEEIVGPVKAELLDDPQVVAVLERYSVSEEQLEDMIGKATARLVTTPPTG